MTVGPNYKAIRNYDKILSQEISLLSRSQIPALMQQELPTKKENSVLSGERKLDLMIRDQVNIDIK